MAQPFIPAPNCARVELVYSFGGKTAENVFHFQGATPFSAGDLETLAGELKSCWYGTLRDFQHNSLTLVRVRATALDSQTAPGIEYTTGLPQPGVIGNSEALPSNVAVMIKFSTGLRGRSYRGRIYVPGATEVDCSGNLWGGHIGQQVTLLGNSILGPGTFTKGVPVVLSKRNNKAWRTTAHAEPITGYSFSPTVDSQKRRLPGRHSRGRRRTTAAS